MKLVEVEIRNLPRSLVFDKLADSIDIFIRLKGYTVNNNELLEPIKTKVRDRANEITKTFLTQ